MAIVQIMRLHSKTSCAIRFNDRFKHGCIYNMHISSHRLIAWWRYDTPYALCHALCNRVELNRCWSKTSSLMRLTINSPMNMYICLICIYLYIWCPPTCLSDTPFSNMQKEIYNLGISYCLAGCLPPGVPKSPPGAHGFMVGALFGCPFSCWMIMGCCWKKISWYLELMNFSGFSGCNVYSGLINPCLFH